MSSFGLIQRMVAADMDARAAKVSTDNDASGLELGRLDAATPLARIVGRNRTKAEVRRYRIAGRGSLLDIALKDYRGCPWWVRATLGRWLVLREARAYRAASGVPGVATFFGQLGPLTLATRWIDAEPLADAGARQLDPARRQRLAELLDRLHRRGVALGDLHHRDVLVGKDGGIWVVDLATALVCAPRAGPLRRRLFDCWAAADRVALVRLTARAAGQDPELALERVAPGAALWHRRGRRWKRWLRRARGYAD